ncbi:ferrous iron transport protein B [Alphaproteobacteria bacterium]
MMSNMKQNADFFKLLIVGAHNVGKTTLFNHLANAKISIGSSISVIKYRLHTISLHDHKKDVDAVVMQDFDCILCVVDTAYLERDLYLVRQLLKIGMPVIVAINKIDLLEKRTIDIQYLQKQLGCHVLATSITQKGAADVSKFLQYEFSKYIAYHKTLSKIRTGPPHNVLISAQELARNAIIRNVITVKKSLQDYLDVLLLHRIFGLPIFFLVMFSILYLTVHIGNMFKGFFEDVIEIFVINSVSGLLFELHTPKVVVLLFYYGIGTGMKTVISFTPLIMTLYSLLLCLEKSGYMARIALICHNIMGKLGLPDKSIIPLILGFGCNVSAICGARIIENKSQRIATIMLIPFIACSAKLNIFVSFSSIFFHSTFVIFLLYFTCFVFACLGAYIIKYYFSAPFVVQRSSIPELPKYSLPKLKTLFSDTLAKTKSFITGTSKVIIATTTCLYLFSIVDIHGKICNIEDSILVNTSKKLTFFLKPIGVEEQNWQATASLITGVLAKEIIIGNLSVLYGITDKNRISCSDAGDSAYIQKVSFLHWIQKLKHFLSRYIPLSPSYKHSEQSVGVSTADVSSMHEEIKAKFKTQAAAFAYLLLVLLYCPCISVLAAIAKELDVRYAVFTACFMTVFGYCVATLFYYFSTIFSLHNHIWAGLVLTILVVSAFLTLITAWLKSLNRSFA